MAMHGVLAQYEPPGDLPIAESLGDQFEHLALARAQPVRIAARGLQRREDPGRPQPCEHLPRSLEMDVRLVVAIERGQALGQLDPGSGRLERRAAIRTG